VHPTTCVAHHTSLDSQRASPSCKPYRESRSLRLSNSKHCAKAHWSQVWKSQGDFTTKSNWSKAALEAKIWEESCLRQKVLETLSQMAGHSGTCLSSQFHGEAQTGPRFRLPGHKVRPNNNKCKPRAGGSCLSSYLLKRQTLLGQTTSGSLPDPLLFIQYKKRAGRVARDRVLA
jgi:hypothetical protein